jgi:hypothetical protein
MKKRKEWHSPAVMRRFLQRRTKEELQILTYLEDRRVNKKGIFLIPETYYYEIIPRRVFLLLLQDSLIAILWYDRKKVLNCEFLVVNEEDDYIEIKITDLGKKILKFYHNERRLKEDLTISESKEDLFTTKYSHLPLTNHK